MCFFDSHLVQLTSPSWPNWQGWHCTPKEVRKGRTARLRRWALPYVKLATRKVKTSLPNDLKKVIGWPLPFFNMLINIWFSKESIVKSVFSCEHNLTNFYVMVGKPLSQQCDKEGVRVWNMWYKQIWTKCQDFTWQRSRQDACMNF